MFNLLSLFSILTFAALFISGINRDTITLSILCSIPAVCIGLIKIIKEKRGVAIPKNFIGMAAFVIILQIYLFFVKDKINPFNYSVVFGISLIFWLIFYNLKKGNEILQSLILNLTLIYSLFYVVTKLANIDLVRLSDLFFIEGLASRHYHVGDLWAFALLLVTSLNWGKFKLKTWLFLDLGFLFLILSNARSAYLSLFLGFIYFITRKMKIEKYKKIIPMAFISLVVLLFVFSSASKTTLFSRPYFMQSIESFSKYPVGVGMGNFRKVALEYYDRSGDSSVFSIYTHNIFLEALTGVGIFSLLFLNFIYGSVKEILTEQKKNLEWGALFIAILSNFMFDTTYTIPGLIWILFMTLGVFQSKEKIN